MKIVFRSPRQPIARLGNILPLLGAAAFFAGVAPPAHASDPVGIYAFADRVVFEPSDAHPERIQVWGGFALAKGANGYEYQNAQRGYLYFKLRPGDEETCRKEWADLKALAGTGQIVAFGSRYEQANVRVRKAGVKVEDPDVHPKGWGMSKMRDRTYGPIQQLVKLQSTPPGPQEPPRWPAK
jgi:hypothetical protein